MGKSSSQVVGYKYYAGLMVALGNRIERFIGFNADKRGWIAVEKTANETIQVNLPDLFGGDEKEGGFVGYIDLHVGTDDQEQNEYLAKHVSPNVSAYPNLSYLVYRGARIFRPYFGADPLFVEDLNKGFHLVSMSGMMKEVLYWVSRINVKNDGTEQWYKPKAPILDISSDQTLDKTPAFSSTISINCDGNFTIDTRSIEAGWDETLIHQSFFSHDLSAAGGYYGESRWNDNGMGNMSVLVKFIFDIQAVHKVKVSFITVQFPTEPYSPSVDATAIGGDIIYEGGESTGGAVPRHDHTFIFSGTELHVSIIVTPHVYHRITNPDGSETIGYSNIIGGIIGFSNYPLVTGGFTTIFDINPIHKIREILTDDTAMNKPQSSVNDDNFTAAADRIFDEGLGISWAIQEKTCKEAIDELLYHIEAGIRVNRQTGKYEVVLFRDDLIDFDNLLSFGKHNIKNFSPEVANADELVNVLNVSYYDRINIKDSAFNVYDNGNVRTTNQEITQDVKFPYFMSLHNAEKVANWKLKQLSTPTWKGSFTTGIYEARKLNRYDVIKLTWLDLDIVDLPVRVMKISLGDGVDNTVSIDFIEVIPYSNLDYGSIKIDPPATGQPQELLPNIGVAFEMPYYEAVQNFGQTQVDLELSNNNNLGYLLASAKKPQSNSINALLYTSSGAEFKQQNILNYAPNLLLDQNIGFLDTVFAVKEIDAITDASVGSCIVVDSEIMIYESYDAETKMITVKRGALDTHPSAHLADAMAFFYDAYSSYDLTQYVEGETVEARIVTRTPSAKLSLSDTQLLSVDMDSRAYRPYPPNNIKINGQYYIEKTIISSNVVVTWVDRNRVQQTGGTLLGWTDGSVTKETGVTYSIELSESGSVLHSASGIDATTYTIPKEILHVNKMHKLKLWSVRDSFNSYQIFEHDFLVDAEEVFITANVEKNKVTGTTLIAANLNVVVDESLSANMKWDGSSISGKAEPGATITIEVNT
ncbi:hypothetical protein [Acinetobacter modestus]|uniref:hypothetical protein n=3 Tax=Acinetobacter modestus TaxID=1776740 RepID=UPI00301B21C4